MSKNKTPAEKTAKPAEKATATEAPITEAQVTEAQADEAPAEKAPALEVPEVDEPANVKRAKDVFAMYPNSNECYFTSDGTAFTQLQHAMIHGENLKDSKVTTVIKSEVV